LARRVIVVASAIALVGAFSILILWSMASMQEYAKNAITIHYEKIEIKSSSVTKSTDSYFVTISFVSTGDRKTEVDSVLLNGVRWDDPGWTGTIKPLVFGDIAPGAAIDAGASCSGMIVFSDDCEDPGGRRLAAGGDYDYLRITIHSTGGKDYETTVTLAQGPTPGTSMLATAAVAAIALALLAIMARRRSRTKTIKVPVISS